jgi:two-component system NtrC family sensor kinase
MELDHLFEHVSGEAVTDLQVILNAIVEGVCAIDAHGNAVFCNDAFLSMTGFRAEELIGKNVHELVHHSRPDGSPFPADECPMMQSMLAGQSVSVRSDYLWRKDGSFVSVKYCVHSLAQQSDGTKCVVTVQDITEWEKQVEALHNSEERVRRNEDKFRRILTNLPDVAWTIDQSGRMVYISPKVEELVGYRSTEIYATGLKLFLNRANQEDARRFWIAIDDLFSRRQPFDIEFRFQRKDGVWIWLQSRAISTYEDKGTVFADGVLCDVSRRKNAEIELHSKTAFLEAQANSTIDGILVVDANGHRILQNQRMIDIFRIPPEFLVGSDDRPELEYVLQFIKNPEEFLAKVEYLYSNREETSRDEIELTDGTVLDRYSAPVVDKQGKYFGRIWSFRDVTDRKKTEDMLRQLSAAVEQSSVSIVITDPDGKITYVNRKFSESTGYSLDEVAGQYPSILNSGHAPREMYTKLWATIRAGKEWRGEFRNKKKNGEIYWESAAITPIVDEKGNIVHFLAVKEDITARRQLESELRQAQKLEGIGQLAAGIAHEINTPTQFVTDNLTFLHESWGTAFKLIEQYRAAIRDHLQKAAPAVVAELAEMEERCDLNFIIDEVPRANAEGLDGVRRIANIVRAMKEFSHPDSADKTETDLNKGVASTVAIARNEWKYVAEVTTNFDESLPPVVCYSGEVNQVILNLIVNAAHSIKEKLPNGGKGKITISTRRRGAFAEIAISDTGMGIPEAIQNRVYEPFFTTKEVGKGTGQGLAFAHSVVVKKHQGKIWFETEAGKGTTFFIQLPASRPDVREGAP